MRGPWIPGPARIHLGTVCLAVALLGALGACRSPNEVTVPDHLVGVWKTSTPRYADRFLQFTRSAVIFGTGGGGADARSITKLEEVWRGVTILYTVSYRDERGGLQGTLAFTYEPRKNAVIRIAHQQEIAWTKEKR